MQRRGFAPPCQVVQRKRRPAVARVAALLTRTTCCLRYSLRPYPERIAESQRGQINLGFGCGMICWCTHACFAVLRPKARARSVLAFGPSLGEERKNEAVQKPLRFCHSSKAGIAER